MACCVVFGFIDKPGKQWRKFLDSNQNIGFVFHSFILEFLLCDDFWVYQSYIGATSTVTQKKYLKCELQVSGKVHNIRRFLQLVTYGRRIPFPELFSRIEAVDTATIKHNVFAPFADKPGKQWRKFLDSNQNIGCELQVSGKVHNIRRFLQLVTYGRRIPFPELFSRIEAVDTATIKHVANRFRFD
ncbi:insulinase (Peptidase family M16) protein [Artemisia annua]|uniref:Insulinase (Peptidase family M16) protein n=1 Tax=Artemisia annua TaxID=35608 RepID=A0A2U1MI21_ARTAN|nr:insulinase (Peptidase family M16) protein [Artemisia annua]